MDITEIDLDSLTELELWELDQRVKARLNRYADERAGYNRSAGRHGGVLTGFGGYGARDRMRSLV